MSKNWKIAIPSAQLFDIPWKGNQNLTIEQCIVQSPVEIPNKTNVHLWLINLSQFNQSSYLDLLSGDEKIKLNRIIAPFERENRSKSRILLRLILAEYLKIAASEIVFSYGINGKPIIQEPAHKLSFNISHSANHLAVLIDSNRSIGVDIETEERSSAVILQMAKRFFHPSELNKLLAVKVKEQSILFNRIWTLKEAVLKSSGSGMFLIDKAPDFSFLIQKTTASRLQFYQTDQYVGFTFFTKDFWLSTAVEFYD